VTDTAAKLPALDGPVTHTHIGGQAVLEGIMMRGRYNWAVAVRTADGSIHCEEHDLASGASKRAWMRWPVVRGCVALVETLALAMQAFSVSASLAGETEEEQLSSKEISITMALGGVLAVVFFILLPVWLTNLVTQTTAANNPLLWNPVDGLIRVAAFFAYIWAIGRMGDIKRVFAYHGAEHKTIHAYEHNLPLDTDIIQRYETLHVRCGTSFLLMVMIVAILVFSLVPVRLIAASMGLTAGWQISLIAIVSRLALLPVVAGLAYEITVKWAGNHSENPFVRVLLWPGLQMQRMTTAEPDDSMVEVAVAAMSPIIAREDREAAIARGESVEPVASAEPATPSPATPAETPAPTEADEAEPLT